MPNHTVNQLTIVGTYEDVAAFVAKARQGHDTLSFQKFVPCDDTIEDHRLSWGTKWDAYDTNLKYEDNPLVALADAARDDSTAEAVFWFHTAWCYPEPVIDAILDQHPELEIEHRYLYEDGGGGINTRGCSTEIVDDSEEYRALVLDFYGYDCWAICHECGEEAINPPRPGPKQCKDCFGIEREWDRESA